MLDYNHAGMEKPECKEEPFWMSVVLLTGVFVNISELLSYLSIYVYLYNYNNGLSILPPEAKKRRNKTNAQTMMGQFYFSITDMLYSLTFFVAVLPGISLITHDANDVAVFLKTLEFGFMSVAQCFLIPDMRRKFLAFLTKRPID